MDREKEADNSKDVGFGVRTSTLATVLRAAAAAIVRPETMTNELSIDESGVSANVFEDHAVRRSTDGWILKFAYDEFLGRHPNGDAQLVAFATLRVADTQVREILRSYLTLILGDGPIEPEGVGIVWLSSERSPETTSLALRYTADTIDPPEQPKLSMDR